MKKWMFPVIFVLVLAPSIAFADAAWDDDYWTDDTAGGDDQYQNTCADLCAKASDCNTTCIPGSCMTYCADNMTQADIECAAESSCSQFNECVLNAVQNNSSDDDGSDDNAGGGDDDDDGGCGCSISGGESGIFLPIAMFAIGLGAFALNLRSSKPRK